MLQPGNSVNFSQYGVSGAGVQTTSKLISTFSGEVPVDTVIETLGYTTEGDGGGASWKKTAATGTVSQSPAQLGDALLNDASGNQWTYIGSKLVPEQLGGVGDGVFDNRLVLLACFSVGRDVYIAADKNYLALINSAAEKLNFRDGLTLSGVGTITLKNSSAIYMEFIGVHQSNITIDGVKFVGDIFAGTSGFFFTPGGFGSSTTDNVRFLNGGIDLQNTVVGITGFHAVHGFTFDRAFSNHTWSHWTFERCNYATIKTNTATGAQSNTTITNCVFKNNVRGNLTGFNTPSAISENIQITNNHFIRELAYFIDIQDQTLMGGCAGGRNVVFTGNTGYGYGRDVIHFEETEGRIVVSNNVFKHLGGGDDGGITFRSNAVGGPAESVHSLIVANNVCVVDGAAVAGSKGIWLVWDGDGALGATDVIIEGNIVDGYEYGIDLGDTSASSVVQGNLVKNSTIGLITNNPTQSISNNTCDTCTTGLVNRGGGTWGKNNFVDCGKVFGFEGTQINCISTGFSYELREEAIVNGTINGPFNLATIPLAAQGRINYCMTFDTGSNSQYAADLTVAASVITGVTRVLRNVSGNPAISSTDTNIITNNAGDLAVTATNSSGFDVAINISVSFEGTWLV